MNIRETRASKSLIHVATGPHFDRYKTRCGRLLLMRGYAFLEMEAVETDEPATCLRCVANESAP